MPEEAAQDTSGQQTDYQPPATQADLDRMIADRLARERAKYADYDDLKTKAAEFDKASEAQKSEAQRALERAEAAEAAAATSQQQLLRYKVAAEKQIPSELAELLTGSTEEEMAAVADRLASFTGQPAPQGFDHGPRGGGPPPTDMNTLIARSLGR